MAIQQSPNTGLRELALFAGAGGGILGGHLLGWRTVCAVECDAYAASVLAQRQNDKILPPFPIWSDIRNFNSKPWKGYIDVVSGGFPCQDISPARTNSRVNGRAKGLEGDKSGLWFEMLRIVNELSPPWVFIENSVHLRTKGLEEVIEGLAAGGYACAWTSLSAKEVGANHERKRLWILAYSHSAQREGGCLPCGVHQKNSNTLCRDWWETSSGIHRVDDGVAHRVDRLRAIGNGQVPAVAANAFLVLQEALLGGEIGSI